MACDDRQLTQAQLEAGFQNQRTGVQKAIRPFSGEATPESLADYLNKEVFPVLQQARAKLNEVFLQVVDNAPSGNPLAFYFSDETADADPTAGRIRLDAATQNTATTMRVSEENGRLVDVAPWLDVMAGGATSPLGTITLFDAINPGRFIRWDLDSMTDQGAYWDLGITVIESSHDNPFVDGEGVVISFIPGVSAAGSTVPVGSLSPVAAETFIGNFTAAPAAPTARAGSSIAGTGLAYAAGGTLSVDATLAEILANGNTTGANDIHVSTGQQLIFDVGGDALGDIQSLGTLQVRTASAMDFRASTGNVGFAALAGNFNMSGTSQLNMTASAASGFIRFITAGVTRFIIAGDGSWQLAGDDGTTGELLQSQGATSPPIWGQAVTGSYTDGSVTLPKVATQAAGTVLANVTAGAASPTAHALSALAGSGLTYTNVTGVMDVDDVALTALADQADDTFLANISGGAAPPTAVALTTLAGAGLTGGANAVLAVGAGTGIAVNANDVAVDATWAEILANGNNSGAFNPHIDSGQYIGFGTEGTLPIALATDIQHSGSLAMAAGTNITLTAGVVNLGSGLDGDIRLLAGVSTGAIELDAGADTGSTIDLSGGGLITLSSASGILVDGPAEVASQTGLYVNSAAGVRSNGFVSIGEMSDANATTFIGTEAGIGAYSTENTSPTRPRFTDDTGAHWKIGLAALDVITANAAATNATTNLTCTTYTVPANTWRVGTLYRLTGWFVLVTSGAPPTITAEVLVGGSVVETVVFTPSPSVTRNGIIQAVICCRSTGAGGTIKTDIQIDNSAGVDVANGALGNRVTTTDAVDTTTSQALLLRVRMTTAVASNTLTVVQGYTERLA